MECLVFQEGWSWHTLENQLEEKEREKNPPAPSFYSQDNKSIRFISSISFLERRREAQAGEKRKRKKEARAYFFLAITADFLFIQSSGHGSPLTSVLGQSHSSGVAFTVRTCWSESVHSRDRKRNWNLPKHFLWVFFLSFFPSPLREKKEKAIFFFLSLSSHHTDKDAKKHYLHYVTLLPGGM